MPLSLMLAHDPEPCPGAPHVIVAEDDMAFRQLISHTLRAEGFIVEEVGDSAELFERVSLGSSQPGKSPIDLVLSVTSLPGHDGIGLLLGIHAKRQRIPLILISHVGDRRTQVLTPNIDEMSVTSHPFALGTLPALAWSLCRRESMIQLCETV